MDDLTFVSQTSANDAGDYTMIFKDADGNLHPFKCNLFAQMKALMKSTESGAKILKQLGH